MNEKVANAFWVMLYSFLAGLSLSLFTQITGFTKYIFSLLAIYIAIRFFRRFETVGKRVLFVVLSLIFCFIGILSITAYLFMRNPELFNGM
ncbi:hypothetical protein [Paenibacillus soyae]|uniref:Uncharacterized protein n=1 Tax=Paenibacillus soyae TaxID=2969249 RepID=A0A9X2MQC6_9BACL|nr:hypothetical protein [Paenibacillus soyae]MCR2804924.1 hypothetical protein [Paenibacillus soyae]